MPDNQDLIAGVAASAAPGSAVPQFSTAEYAHLPGTERCRICGGAISGEYYRVNGQMACSRCGTEAGAGQPVDSHAAFARGLLLGAGAALLGLICYAAFTAVTGWYLGYIALGVGWLVGAAIRRGSNGMGGRRYQVAAVLLTYASISLAQIPIVIADAMKHGSSVRQTASAVDRTGADAAAQGASPAGANGWPGGAEVNWGAEIAQLALLGLASPFLGLSDPGHGLIGLVILFIGLRVAFRQTAARQLAVDGPFGVTG